MTIWYVDPTNGVDASAGSSFATRCKTLAGVSAKSIVAGDSVRIIASPAPAAVTGQSTTAWTDGSKTVTLASAVTANITLATASWTASTNVTTTTSTNRKVGATSASIAVAAGFTTGLAAYFATGTLDLSGYEQVSFWIQMSSGTMSADGDISLVLCSDTAGATAVNTISVPWIKQTAQWQCITVNTGAALGSSIQSVALYINQDRAAQTFLISNILACKAVSASDSITLNSLISPTNSPTDSSDWWVIDSINGTTISLGQEHNYNLSSAAAIQGYSNPAGNTTGLSKRDPIVLPSSISDSSNTGTTWGAFTKAGSSFASPITVSGGWNTTDMSTQTGSSFISTYNGFGSGGTFNVNYVTVSKLNPIRFYFGLSTSVGSAAGLIISADSIVGCGNIGCNISGSQEPTVASGCSLTLTNVLQNSTGISFSQPGSGATINAVNICANTTVGFKLAGAAPGTSSVASVVHNVVANVTNLRRNGATNSSWFGSNGGLQVIGASNCTVTFENAGFNYGFNILFGAGGSAISAGQTNNKIFFTNTSANPIETVSGMTSIVFSDGVNNTVYLTDTTSNATLSITAGQYAIAAMGRGVGNTVVGGSIAGSLAAVSTNAEYLTLQNTTLASGTAYQYGLSNAYRGPMTLYWQAYGNVATDNRIYFHPTYAGQITSDTTTRHTASGISWKMTTAASVSAASPNANSPMTLPIGQVAVNASSTVTATIWLYSTSATPTVKFRCDAGTTAGVSAFQTSSTTINFTGQLNQWVQATLVTNPTNAGVCSYFVVMYGTTSSIDVYVDDFSVGQA